jgi:hypothetical protein
MDLNELLDYICNRECSLFLGSGASVSGGGPTGKELLNEIRKKYTVAATETNFFFAFDKILSPTNAERAAVEEFVRSNLVSITPTDNHRYLFSVPWRVVLTTNYDRIPELIDTTLDGNRTIFTVNGTELGIDFRRNDRLYCFKLFGDMSMSSPNEGCMVLTNKDRRRAYYRQANFFKLFQDLARSGVIIYLGYSFEDELVFDILDDMKYELKGFSDQGFAIIPNAPPNHILEKMREHNIEWVAGTLDDFVAVSKRFFGNVPKSCAISSSPIRVHGRIIDISKDTFLNLRGKAEILNQKMFTSDYDSPKYFFEGNDHSFVPYQKRWDFPRNWKLTYCGTRVKAECFLGIEEFIKCRSATGNPSDNIIIGLIGSAGSGKSVATKRIAFEWYTNGNPVLFLDSNNVFLDSNAIESILDEIWDKYRKDVSEGVVLKELRHLIVCDNCSLLFSQIMQLANQLMSAGKPVDILIIDRSSELPDTLLKEMDVDVILTLEDTITLMNQETSSNIIKDLMFFQTCQL